MLSSVTTTISSVGSRGVSTVAGGVSSIYSSLFDLISLVIPNLPNILDFSVGCGSLVCLYYMVKNPWDYYFKSKSSRIQLEKNRLQGLEIINQDLNDSILYEKWLLVYAVGLHLVSAAGIYAFAIITSERFIKSYVSWIFLGTILIRPVLASHGHVQSRLLEINKRVVYPDPEIINLRRELTEIKSQEKENKKALKKIDKRLTPELRNHFRQVSKFFEENENAYQNNHRKDLADEERNKNTELTENKHLANELAEFKKDSSRLVQNNSKETTKQYETLSKTIDESVHALVNEKQMISGVKQFLNLLRENLYQSPITSNSTECTTKL